MAEFFKDYGSHGDENPLTGLLLPMLSDFDDLNIYNGDLDFDVNDLNSCFSLYGLPIETITLNLAKAFSTPGSFLQLCKSAECIGGEYAQDDEEQIINDVSSALQGITSLNCNELQTMICCGVTAEIGSDYARERMFLDVHGQISEFNYVREDDLIRYNPYMNWPYINQSDGLVPVAKQGSYYCVDGTNYEECYGLAQNCTSVYADSGGVFTEETVPQELTVEIEYKSPQPLVFGGIEPDTINNSSLVNLDEVYGEVATTFFNKYMMWLHSGDGERITNITGGWRAPAMYFDNTFNCSSISDSTICVNLFNEGCRWVIDDPDISYSGQGGMESGGCVCDLYEDHECNDNQGLQSYLTADPFTNFSDFQTATELVNYITNGPFSNLYNDFFEDEIGSSLYAPEHVERLIHQCSISQFNSTNHDQNVFYFYLINDDAPPSATANITDQGIMPAVSNMEAEWTYGGVLLNENFSHPSYDSSSPGGTLDFGSCDDVHFIFFTMIALYYASDLEYNMSFKLDDAPVTLYDYFGLNESSIFRKIKKL